MSFDKDGFFSPEMERFRSSLRSVPEYKAWLEYAENLNRIALDMLEGHEPQSADNQRLMISILFVRAHKSFQAAITLAEMGLLGDARAVVRRATEGSIALNALANDAAFTTQLINAHLFWQRKAARLLLNNPDYRATYSPEQIAEMEATVKDVDAKETASGGKFSEINWADVAGKHCKDLYETIYRLLSSDGTHTTITAIHREVIYDGSGKIAGLKVGPDTDGMIETLKSVCMIFLWAFDPFIRAYGKSEVAVRISEKLKRFQQMPQDEPKDAQVIPNFLSQQKQE